MHMQVLWTRHSGRHRAADHSGLLRQWQSGQVLPAVRPDLSSAKEEAGLGVAG